MFGAIVKAGSNLMRSATGGGRGTSTPGGLRVARNPNLGIARQQIIDYTGQDFLGMATSLSLDVNSVAQLADIQRYMAEQKELIGYAVKRLEAITNDAVQIEGAIAQIITHQLKSRSEVDKFISAANLAGDRYGADSAKLNQHHTNQQRLIAGATAGEMALDNVKTKMALLAQKQKFDLSRKTLEINQKTQQRSEAASQVERTKQAQEAAARRHLLNNGTGKSANSAGFTRFKSQI